MLKIHWKNDFSKNYIDLIPERWISLSTPRKNVQHSVLSPKKELLQALCDVTPNGKTLEIDYRSYSTPWEQAQGVLRLIFSDSSTLGMPEVFWRDWDKDEQEPCSDCTKVSYELDELTELEDENRKELVEARGLDQAELERRAQAFSGVPARRRVTTTVLVRNPAVVELARRKAGGKCQQCGASAPFVSKNTGEPYLEIHHKEQLANGGKDIVENTIALCPNCHRKAHFG